jgi:hypothetical protein
MKQRRTWKKWAAGDLRVEVSRCSIQMPYEELLD